MKEDPVVSKEQNETPENEEETDMKEISLEEMTNQEFVVAMGAGWNLGNAMDTKSSDETAWGNPITTKAMIDEIADMGFKTLRVPVTWQFHMGEGPNFEIEPVWLDKVENIVNFGLENQMFVIINIHHDEEWIVPVYENAEATKNQVSKVWSQIAERFKDYDHHLIFETLNEPRHKETPEEWTGGTDEGRDMVNQFHKVGLEAIRATGSKNETRKIMVSTYAASTDNRALDQYLIPNNDKNVLVSVHSYFPYQFALEGSDPKWGTSQDQQDLTAEFEKIENMLITNNRAVVMGEWGSTFNDNPEDRLAHAKFYAKGCADRGICPIWWDNGNKDEFAIFDRRNLTWIYPEIAEALVNAVKK